MNFLTSKNKQALTEHLRDFVTPNASRDWFTLMTLFFLMLAAIVVWNVVAFGAVANRESVNTFTAKDTAIFNQSSLDTIHAVFSDRDAEQTKYMSGVYNFTDPSQ